MSSKMKSILLIENSPSERDELTTLLDNMGYQVEQAATGEEALKLFGQNRHDLVIIEVLIPGIGGLPICKIIKEQGADWVKTIVTSKLQQSRTIRDSALSKFKADAFMQKPFEAGALAKTVMSLIGPGTPGAKPSTPPREQPSEPEPVQPSEPVPPPEPERPAEPVRIERPFDMGAPPQRRTPEKKVEGGIDSAGAFTQESFARLLVGIMTARYTGAFRVEGDSGAKQIFFTDGIPVFVQSNIREEALGRLLLAQGRITEEVYRQVISESSETGRKIGNLLLSKGILTAEELADSLHQQTAVKVANLFSWIKGNYQLAPEIVYPVNAASFEAAPAEIILLAYRRYCPERLPQALFQKSRDRVLIYSKNIFFDNAYTFLTPEEEKLCAVIDGRKTFGQVIEKTEMETEPALRMINAFLDMGLLRLEKRSSVKASGLEDGSHPLTDSARMDREELKRYQHIEELATRLADLTFFELLGVTPEARPEEIDSAYADKAERYNPTVQNPGAPSGVVRRAKAILERLKEAHSTLSDPASRRKYAASLTKDLGPIAPDDPESETKKIKLDAEVAFQKGLVAFEKKRFAFAADAFENAAKADPGVAEYHGRAGYSLFRMVTAANATIDEAMSLLARAITLDPSRTEYRIWIAEIYRHLGKDEAALGQCMKVLEIEPRNEEAKRQVHYLRQAIDGKKEKGREKDGLKSLFGRKK